MGIDMIRHVMATSILLISTIFVAPEATAAKRPCSALKGDIQEMLNAPYSGAEADAAMEYARRIVKAYSLGFANKNCLTAKEYNGLITGVNQLRDDCAKAKLDKATWADISKRCNIYKALYKFAKLNP